MTYAGWHIDLLSFEGKDGKRAQLTFAPGLSLIYGASNTGKSFAVKALDFMLGGSQELPNINERRPYDRLEMGMTLTNSRKVRLERALAGGSFTLHEHGREAATLAPRHDADSVNNLSNFLLREMGSVGKKIALDAAGTHGNLSFRDIARVVLTDELSIQSETSPIESGDRGAATRERSVLKYLLTGDDDSAVVPLIKPKDFRTGRIAQTKILEEMIEQINGELSSNYPDYDGLEKQSEDLDALLQRIENEIANARSSVRLILDNKRRLTSEIAAAERRAIDIGLSLNSFEQLQEVYDSDVARLESIEEVGFLLGLGGKRICPVCGAPPEYQEHTHGLVEIESVRVGSAIRKAHRGRLGKVPKILKLPFNEGTRPLIAKIWNTHDEFLGEAAGNEADGLGVVRAYVISADDTPSLQSSFAGRNEAGQYGPMGVFTFPNQGQFAGSWAGGHPSFGYREYLGERSKLNCDFYLGSMKAEPDHLQPLWRPHGEGIAVDAALRRVRCGFLVEGIFGKISAEFAF
jgi:hypothetical protein